MSNPWDNSNQSSPKQPPKLPPIQYPHLRDTRSTWVKGIIIFIGFIILVAIISTCSQDNNASSANSTATDSQTTNAATHKGRYAKAQMNDALREELEDKAEYFKKHFDRNPLPVEFDAVIDQSIDAITVGKLVNIVREQGNKCRRISTITPDTANSSAYHMSCDHRKHSYYLNDSDQGATTSGNWIVTKDQSTTTGNQTTTTNQATVSQASTTNSDSNAVSEDHQMQGKFSSMDSCLGSAKHYLKKHRLSYRLTGDKPDYVSASISDPQGNELEGSSFSCNYEETGTEGGYFQLFIFLPEKYLEK